VQKGFWVARKIRDLIQDLKNAGFMDRGGEGNHRNFTYPNVRKPVTVSGNTGDDALYYQERAIRLAIQESKK
jgi:predicted RNA binding protein YcfA (HicA-like mRNA interferase family)